VIRQYIARGDLRTVSYFAKVTVREIHPDEMPGFDPARLSYANVNTPEELARAAAMLRTRRGD
jgi:molybdopterin-guanine dinucleotide biosynthesis protein A